MISSCVCSYSVFASFFVVKSGKKLSPKPGCKKVAAKLETKKARMKRSEIKMGGQGQCSVSADGNVILMITIQAAKH